MFYLRTLPIFRNLVENVDNLIKKCFVVCDSCLIQIYNNLYRNYHKEVLEAHEVSRRAVYH